MEQVGDEEGRRKADVPLRLREIPVGHQKDVATSVPVLAQLTPRVVNVPAELLQTYRAGHAISTRAGQSAQKSAASGGGRAYVLVDPADVEDHLVRPQMVAGEVVQALCPADLYSGGVYALSENMIVTSRDSGTRKVG